MYRFLITVICLFQGACLMSQSSWELKRDRDGIVIYTREPGDSPLKEYRVNTVYDFPLEDVYALTVDLESRPEWVSGCTGLEIIDTAGGRIRYHASYDFPWPLQDRDLVAEMELVRKGPDRAHLLTRSIDLDYPLRKGVIRMPDYREEVRYEKIDEHKTGSGAEGFVDPGGSVPAWFVNIFLVETIYDSVIRTREWMAGKR